MLKLTPLKPRQYLAPLFSKKSIQAEAFARFLMELERLMKLDQSESEEYQKNRVKDFLVNTYGYEINTKGRIDLAIFGQEGVEVIMEFKSLANTAEMITHDALHKKAFAEAIKYFFDERAGGNHALKHILILTAFEWYVFDAKEFERLFWQERVFREVYDAYTRPDSLLSKTGDVYAELVARLKKLPSKESLLDEPTIEGVYVNLQSTRSEKEQIALYKLLSPDTLLKRFNPNDANTLDRAFYAELLYLLGLEEVKDGGKKVIRRAAAQHSGSLYENIVQKLSQHGKPTDFESVIRLMIIWINRILFLKLLESQLIKWNGSDDYAFLNAETIRDFDRLETLFFDILAHKPHERAHREFDHIPYLNSSLFEPHEFERKTMMLSSLQDDCDMPYYPKTVLKDVHGKRKEGEVNMLHYLFAFLDAYDFASEGSEEVVARTKSLINASVLGLIFEKLNGYKDGSFYTPSFITMHMSRETITRAVIDRFNQAKGWDCATLDDLDDRIEDKHEANTLINTLTICDPAVGSGHFLVSTLNTILEIKSRLRILYDAEGKRIKDYDIRVENDELIVWDDEGEIFEYTRRSREATRIQRMLFHEKQQIIERSLFGVDINPNSAQITRLRLWIELLKNSYYDESGSLVTMPNIDINIKVGNSLVSRYGLHDEITIPNIKHAIEEYKHIVRDYKEGDFLVSKEEIRTAIDDLKAKFGLTLQAQWKQTQTYKKVLGEYVKEYGMEGLPREVQLDALEYNYGYHGNLFGDDLTAAQQKTKTKLYDKVIQAHKAIEEIEKGKIYEDAFEWRFEFPEVLDAEGNFTGFDVVIGNPPYIALSKLKEIDYGRFDYRSYDRSGDILALFVERSLSLLQPRATLSLITSNSWLKTRYGEALKSLLAASDVAVDIVNFEDTQIFDEATVETCILTLTRGRPQQMETVNIRRFDARHATLATLEEAITTSATDGKATEALMHRIEERGTPIKNWHVSYYRGVTTGFNQAFIIDSVTKDDIASQDPKSLELLKPLIRGKDVQKYLIDWKNKWLITTFPAMQLDIKHYPSIERYLLQFKKRLEQTGEKGSRKKTKNEWFESQDSIAYYEEFSKPKIIWGEMSDSPKFTYDDTGYYLNNTLFMMTGENLKYLLAILNSKLSKWYFERISTTTGMGTTRWLIYKVELLPVAKTDNPQPFIDLVDQILTRKAQNEPTTDLEERIDAMVYDLYGLSDEEIAVVEGREP